MKINMHWMHRNAWENNKHELVEMAKFFETLGVKSILLPYGPNGLDYLLHTPNILNATNKVRILIALPAYAVTPEYAAKIFWTMRQFNGHRLDLNLVAGNYAGELAESVLNDYPGDTSHIDTHEKRVALTGHWIEKFTNLMKNKGVVYTSYVVGESDMTIGIANQYTDFLIINHTMLWPSQMHRLTNVKPMLAIDPLIIDNLDDIDKVEYYHYAYEKKSHHQIKGTYEEVVAKIKQISEEHKIYDFIVHTDQKNLEPMFKMMKELSSQD
jgi:hypothetical protein